MLDRRWRLWGLILRVLGRVRWGNGEGMWLVVMIGKMIGEMRVCWEDSIVKCLCDIPSFANKYHSSTLLFLDFLSDACSIR